VNAKRGSRIINQADGKSAKGAAGSSDPASRPLGPGKGDSGRSFYLDYLTRAGSKLDDIQKLSLTATHHIQHIATLLHDRAEARASSHGLHVTDMYVLLLLHRSLPDYSATSTELGHALSFTSGGMTKRVDRLEAMGLVRRNQHPTDRRASLVQLTDAGKALVERVRNVVDDKRLLGHQAALLSEEEWSHLVGYLERLAEGIAANLGEE